VLNRRLYKKEYDSVIEKMEALGSETWVQDIGSNLNYMPDSVRRILFE